MIGWLGSILFSLCALPQTIKTFKDGHAKSLSTGFLFLWTGGEVLTLIAVIQDKGSSYLLANYISNLVLLAIIIRYKVFPREK